MFKGGGKMSKTEASNTRKMAEYYVSQGWHIFPVDGEKRPKTKNGFKDAILKADQFKIGDGIGIATGQVSGLVVVDLDEKNGKHGIQAFKDLMQGHPDIITRTVKTPTGGDHLYFKHSGPLKTRIDHPADGIDFKADGGYVVAPPSVLRNGDFYSVVSAIEPVPLPDWLIEVFTGPGRDDQPAAGTGNGTPGTPAVKKAYRAPVKITAGSRNDTLYRTACSLAAKGIGDNAVLAAVLQENKEKCSPPLEEDEVRALWVSACTFNRQNPTIKPSSGQGKTAAVPVVRQAQIIIEPVDPRIQARADEILKNGEPLDLFKTAYELNHEGDNEILRAVVYGSCLQSSSTTHGLQVFISGGKGTGKSNAIKAAINLIPPSDVTQGSFSDKAFFWQLAGRIKPAVFLDDITISDSQVATMKRCMTNFQMQTDHHTISAGDNGKRGIEVQTIPARTMWLGTAVSETGDDQLKNRYLSLDIIPGEKDNSKYIAWELKRRQEGRPEIEINDDVKIARAIIGHIKKRDFIVKGFENIRFKFNHDRRLINIALDLIEGSAILHYLQRKHEEINGVIHIIPEMADLTAALDFTMFRITDTRSDGRLTRSERALDELIQGKIGQKENIELSEREIVDLSGKTTNPVRTLLYGRDGTQSKITGGLLEKASWYRIDRGEIEDNKGNRRRTGQAVIVISKHGYGPEHAGSFAWLEDGKGVVLE